MLLIILPKKSYAMSLTGTYSPTTITLGQKVHIQGTFTDIPGNAANLFIADKRTVTSSTAGTGDMISLFGSCDDFKRDKYWSNVTCTGDMTGTTTFSFSGDWDSTFLKDNADMYYTAGDTYQLYYGINQFIPGGFIVGASAATFSIDSVSPNPAREGVTVTVKLKNAIAGDSYDIFINSQLDVTPESGSCGNSGGPPCELTLTFTVPPIPYTSTTATVVDMSKSDRPNLTIPITFIVSNLVGITQCLTCSPPDSNWNKDDNNPKCVDSGGTEVSPKLQETCSDTETCKQGTGCQTKFPTNVDSPLDVAGPPLSCAARSADGTTCTSINTGLGFAISTDVASFTKDLVGIVLSIAGGIAILLIIISGYRIMVSQGNPENIKNAREQLTAAIVGLLFVIFSLVILQVIGVNILGLPGISP